NELIDCAFGATYRSAAAPLLIMCFGQLANTSCGSVGVVRNMTGHEKDTLKGIIIAIVVSIVLMLALVPSYGAVGAATAYTASLIIWNLTLVFLTRKRTGISTFVI